MIEYLPLVLTGIGMIVSILYYTNVLRNAQRTRDMTLKAQKTQIFNQIHGTITKERIDLVNEVRTWEWTDIDDFQDKYGERWSEVEAILQRYNGMGLLAKQDLLDLDLVYTILILPIRGLWSKFESIINHRRELYDVPELYEGFEYLYHELMKPREK